MRARSRDDGTAAAADADDDDTPDLTVQQSGNAGHIHYEITLS